MVGSNLATGTSGERQFLRCRTLPLAVYREVAAHLRQVGGVRAGLVPQSSPEFDYALSQIGSLWIEYADDTDAAARDRVDRILTYYGDRYGAWERQ
ncbi:MAG: hypothetical protein SWY16_20610 [Cyanobacteriota bacterium]|nr:hypothetical protein [Cyanobacteriota bacterium]